MKERISTYLRLPWLATLRRVVLSGSAFVVLGCFANHVRAWEGDFYGHVPVHVGLTIAARVGCVVVLLVGLWLLLRWGVGQWLSRRKKTEPEPEPTETVEDGEAVQAELPLTYPEPPVVQPGRLRRWWDVWFFLLMLAVCVPLGYWYDYRDAGKSTLSVSCQGANGDYVFERAVWQSANAVAEGVMEKLPASAPYLHTFRLPNGDFRLSSPTGATSFALSHIRSTRRFTLKPHFDIEGEVDLYICPIRNEADRRRVRTLLNYYMENPQSRRPRIKRMSFTRCQDAAVLYLDYGEYVLLPVPRGSEPSDAPSLIYFSLLP